MAIFSGFAFRHLLLWCSVLVALVAPVIIVFLFLIAERSPAAHVLLPLELVPTSSCIIAWYPMLHTYFGKYFPYPVIAGVLGSLAIGLFNLIVGLAVCYTPNIVDLSHSSKLNVFLLVLKTSLWIVTTLSFIYLIPLSIVAFATHLFANDPGVWDRDIGNTSPYPLSVKLVWRTYLARNSASSERTCSLQRGSRRFGTIYEYEQKSEASVVENPLLKDAGCDIERVELSAGRLITVPTLVELNRTVIIGLQHPA